jgi:hypothetical protein
MLATKHSQTASRPSPPATARRHALNAFARDGRF